MVRPPPNGVWSQRAFTLVEVVLSIGIVAFAFVAVLGLLPAGLSNFRQAMETSVGSQIAQRIIAEAQQTDFDVLIDEENLPTTANFTFRAPKVGAPALRYFDEQGNEILPSNPAVLSAGEKLKVLYHVNVRVMPRTSLPRTNSGGDAPHMATLTVQVAGNPAGIAIPLSSASPSDDTKPDRSLFIATPGVTIRTYAAHVGRNQ